jgi:putative mRNA 3-end processing factor
LDNDEEFGMALNELLIVDDRGIYCAAGDFYIDPWKAVPRALITHAHSDHARSGHSQYICHTDCAPVLRLRLGAIQIQTLSYSESIFINGVKVSLHPAGHIIGSAQVRVEYKGEVWVVSGDYKTDPDGISVPFEPVPCHTFISESTFGLPVYDWQPQQVHMERLNDWWASNGEAGICSVIFAYSLGKAQRILQGIDHSIGPVYTHGAVEQTNEVLRAQGIKLKSSAKASKDVPVSEYRKALLIAPMSADRSPWMKKFGEYSTAVCSGWMTLRGARRRYNVDLGIPMSDHADWKGLNEAVRATGAERVFITHGFSDVFARWLCEKGLDARVLKTLYEGEVSTEESTEA